MKLEEVLPALRAGKKVRRKGWADIIYLQYNCGPLFPAIDLMDNGVAKYPFSFSSIDALADDWEIVEEPKCELCQGVKKLSVWPDSIYLTGLPKTIECPECVNG